MRAYVRLTLHIKGCSTEYTAVAFLGGCTTGQSFSWLKRSVYSVDRLLCRFFSCFTGCLGGHQEQIQTLERGFSIYAGGAFVKNTPDSLWCSSYLNTNLPLSGRQSCVYTNQTWLRTSHVRFIDNSFFNEWSEGLLMLWPSPGSKRLLVSRINKSFGCLGLARNWYNANTTMEMGVTASLFWTLRHKLAISIFAWRLWVIKVFFVTTAQ